MCHERSTLSTFGYKIETYAQSQAVESGPALWIRATLRDLMDWNGPKVDYVIAASTTRFQRREER